MEAKDVFPAAPSLRKIAALRSPVELGVINRKRLPFPGLVLTKGFPVPVLEATIATTADESVDPVALIKLTVVVVLLLDITRIKFAGVPKVINRTVPPPNTGKDRGAEPAFSRTHPVEVFVIVTAPAVTGAIGPSHAAPGVVKKSPLIRFRHAILVISFYVFYGSQTLSNPASR